MGFGSKWYGLWGMGELWVLGLIFPGTSMVDPKKYGLQQSMGVDSYGLFQSRLYIN